MKFENRRCGPLIRIGLRTAWLVLIALHTLCAGPQPASAAEQLNLGMISDSPARTIKKFAPLLDYLRNKGLPMGQVINARSLDEMTELLKNKKVDFVFESSNSAIRMMDEAGAIPILIREKDGIREYNSVIFVNKNSPVKKMTDLLGKIVVFQDPKSTSSYFLPRNLLAGAGLDLIEANEPVPGKVAYYFSRSDPNVLAHVKLGKADAGGTSSEAVAHLPQFRILQPESGYVPRHVVLVRDGVDYGELKKALLSLAKDPAASDVLTTAETPTGFSEFEGDPREAMNHVRATLGR